VEQRWYAHRKYRNLIVHELQLLSTAAASICITQVLGPPSADISFAAVNTTTPSFTRAISGKIKSPELTTSDAIQVSVVYPAVGNPNTTNCFSLSPKETIYYPVVFVTDLEGGDVHSANMLWMSLNGRKEQLLDEHIKEWQKVWISGLEVGGDLHLARALNSRYDILLRKLAKSFLVCTTFSAVFGVIGISHSHLEVYQAMHIMDMFSGTWKRGCTLIYWSCTLH
jgi:hypothetical protein